MADKPDIQSILQQMQMLVDQLASAGVAANPSAPTSTPVPLDEGSQQVYYAPPATYRVKEGVTLAIDGEKPHWISTNATGAMALRLSNGENTVADIAERIAERYRQPLSTVLTDTAAYLETLSGIEYVSQSPRLAPPIAGEAKRSNWDGWLIYSCSSPTIAIYAARTAMSAAAIMCHRAK